MLTGIGHLPWRGLQTIIYSVLQDLTLYMTVIAIGQ